MAQASEDSDLINASKHLVKVNRRFNIYRLQNLFPSVMKAVKISHEFPTRSTPAFNYYNDHEQYKTIMGANCDKILST